MIGRRLGPYEVLAKLGEGGMGEVYRARDTSLGRDVAIKVLPPEFAADADRLARFEREARTLASLNHPNIAIVHGLERSGATQALVMELVDGPTLADRIVEGPIPVDHTVDIARQIAHALEAAHEQGVIHRDLKPANIKVRQNGTVKVLDFGLAKLVATAEAGHGARDTRLTASPTMTSPAMTQAGIILGTAGYMSPEQARGQEVDKRSDIWAFGCVLYEMLTGRPAFAGNSVTETLAAVLERNVDFTTLPPATTASVRTVLRRSLEKDPKRRLHDIADARIELDDTAAAATAPDRDRSRTTQTWMVALAAGVATAVVVGVGAWYLGSTASPTTAGTADVTRMVIAPEHGLSPGTDGVLALSPDGRVLAYVSNNDGRRQIYLHRLNEFEGRPIPGTDRADNLAFSPDGASLAFTADQQVKKVAVDGGAPIHLCPTGDGHGLIWESDDTILFNPGPASGISRVSAGGGAPAVVTRLEAGELDHRPFDILPAGKTVLYTTTPVGAFHSWRVVAQSLESGARRVIPGGSGARYLAATGHLLYAQSGTVYAVRFDPLRPEVTGTPTVVLQGVRQMSDGTAQIAFSLTGSMMYVPAGEGERRDTLVWVDRTGVEHPTTVSSPDYTWMPRLMPDLRRAGVVLEGSTTPGNAQSDVWLYDLMGGPRRRLTLDGTSQTSVWSPDGRRLAYTSTRSGRPAIYVRTLDTETETMVKTNDQTNLPFSWSPDGRFLAAVSINPTTTANDIWVYDIDDPSRSRAFAATQFREGAPTFSHDGRFIAYVSEQTGRAEIVMRPFPGPGNEIAISTDGGKEPVWARKAGQLFYRQGDAMMVVDITTTPDVKVGVPRRIFERPFNRSTAFWPNYDVTPDGQRFLMVKDSALDMPPTRINVVFNWVEELKGLVPAN